MGNDPILRLSQSRVLNLYTMVTIELERITRFELVIQPWQGRVLPLYYIRILILLLSNI